MERWGNIFDPATGERTSRVAFADRPGSMRPWLRPRGRLRHGGRSSLAATRARDAHITQPRRAAQARHRRVADARARQGAVGRPGRGDPRPRGGGVRLRPAAVAQGRVLRERLHRRGRLLQSGSRSASWPGSSRSTSRRWSRYRCDRSQSPQGTPSSSSPRRRIVRVGVLRAPARGEAGLQEGVFNVVHGDKVAVDAILGHPGIQAVSFVGSTPIARYVYKTFS